jgi:hypothetical protein
MKAAIALCLSTICLFPAYSFAGNAAVACPAGHAFLAGNAEFRTTGISFRNLDLVNTTTIERITIRNVFGQIVHDSGPAIGVQHPLNTDFPVEYPTGLDITVVPPGAAYYLMTNQIWGVASVPGSSNSQGFTLTVTVEYSKDGKTDLLLVGSRVRSRDVVVNPNGTLSQRGERGSDSSPCTKLKIGDE